MTPEVLTRLLRGEHLNMEERERLGAWPHPPIDFDEVVDHLTRLLVAEQWFPRPWEPYSPGDAIYEGGVIEREAGNRFVYRARRAHPIQPRVLAQETEHVVTDPRAAALHYLKWDLRLPGDLDGWKVVKQHAA